MDIPFGWGSDTWLDVALISGYLAIVVYVMWQWEHKCRYPACPHKHEEEK